MDYIVQQMVDEEARDELAAWEANWGSLLKDDDGHDACACKLGHRAENGMRVFCLDESACPIHRPASQEAA